MQAQNPGSRFESKKPWLHIDACNGGEQPIRVGADFLFLIVDFDAKNVDFVDPGLDESSMIFWPEALKIWDGIVFIHTAKINHFNGKSDARRVYL